MKKLGNGNELNITFDDFSDSFYVGIAGVDANATVEQSQTKNIVNDSKYVKNIAISIPLRSKSSLEMGHILIVGPTGSGKSGILKNNLFCFNHSSIVNDIDGDLYATTANRRREMGQKVFLLDFFRGKGHRYNPIAHVTLEERYDLAEKLIEDTNDSKFWGNTTIAFILATWAAADHAQKPHIPYMVEIWKMGPEKALRYLRDIHGSDSATMQYLEAFVVSTGKLDEIISSPNLVISKWSGVSSAMVPFNNDALLRVFSGNDIDIKSFFSVPSTLYISVPHNDSKTFSIVSRLVVRTLGNTLMKVDEGEDKSKRKPILFLYDEFGKAPLKEIHEWLDVMRSCKVILVIFCQSLNQMAAGDPRYNFENENNIRHFIIFKSPNPGGAHDKRILVMAGRKMYNYELPVGSGKRVTEGDGSKIPTFRFTQSHITAWDIRNAFVVLNVGSTRTYLVNPSPDILGWKFNDVAAPMPRIAPLSTELASKDMEQQSDKFSPNKRVDIDSLAKMFGI